jgi:hypothetical protein
MLMINAMITDVRFMVDPFLQWIVIAKYIDTATDCVKQIVASPRGAACLSPLVTPWIFSHHYIDAVEGEKVIGVDGGTRRTLPYTHPAKCAMIRSNWVIFEGGPDHGCRNQESDTPGITQR